MGTDADQALGVGVNEVAERVEEDGSPTQGPSAKRAGVRTEAEEAGANPAPATDLGRA